MSYEDVNGISRRYYIKNQDGTCNVISYNAHNVDKDHYGNIDFIKVDENSYYNDTDSFTYYTDDYDIINLIKTK